MPYKYLRYFLAVGLIIILALLVLLPLASFAGVRSPMPGLVQVKAGPASADIRLHLPWQTPCNCVVEPDEAPLGPPIIYFSYNPPGTGQRVLDQGYYVNLQGARVVTILVQPDERWNVRRVAVTYERRTSTHLGRQKRYWRSIDDDGYEFRFGGLNGNRAAKVAVTYEDFEGNLIGTRTDCVTIDAGRY